MGSLRVLQSTASECGLACLATVASHFGHEVELSELRSRFALSLRGATLGDLMRIASGLELQSRPVRLEVDEIRELTCPCILHWNLNHFVVLLRADGRGVAIHDPAQGERRLSYREIDRQFTGVALELTPSPAFRRQHAKPPIGWRELIGKAVGLKRGLAQMMLLAACLQVFALVIPFFIQWTVDGAIVSGDRDLLVVLVAGFLMLLTIRSVLEFGRGWVGVGLSNQLYVQWSGRVMGHLIGLPMRWFETRHIGDIVSRFQSVGSIQNTVTSSLVEALLDGVFATVTALMMLLYSPRLSAVVALAIAIYAAIRIASYGAFRRAGAEVLVLDAKAQSHFLESVRGAQSIKLGSLEQSRRAKWSNLTIAATNRNAATQKMVLAFASSCGLIFGLQSVVVLGWGASMAIDGALSVGMLMAFIAYKDEFSSRMQRFIDNLINLRMLHLQVERLADIVLAEQETVSGAMPEQLAMVDPCFDMTIELEDVGYRYGDGEPWVFRHLNLRIATGEHVAIVGPSGCGKSTLVKILLGLLQPCEGMVKVGGIPLRQIGLANWRKQAGVVMQDDQLFSGSLQDNIANFGDAVDLRRVQEAAKLAAVHDEIVQMPMGYHTLIGDMGSSLSGGQKQRLLLARALYKQPRVLVLDEATSHLDVPCEREVNAAIQQLAMTRVVIAHRPETIAMAGRVLALSQIEFRGDAVTS